MQRSDFLAPIILRSIHPHLFIFIPRQRQLTLNRGWATRSRWFDDIPQHVKETVITLLISFNLHLPHTCVRTCSVCITKFDSLFGVLSDLFLIYRYTSNHTTHHHPLLLKSAKSIRHLIKGPSAGRPLDRAEWWILKGNGPQDFEPKFSP
jgi:hypothetical protein